MSPSLIMKCGICKDGWAMDPAISRGPNNPKLMDGRKDDGLYAGIGNRNRWHVDAETTRAAYRNKHVRRVKGKGPLGTEIESVVPCDVASPKICTIALA